jgi:molybdopterin-binding protein
MPRKDQGWITFQSSEEERQILEQICQQTQRTKTEVLREMLRNLDRPLASAAISDRAEIEDSENALDENNLNFPESSELETITLPTLRISARNVFQAKVKKIVKSSVNAEVTLAIAPEIELVSIITRASADRLGLAKGKDCFAVIKSSSVMKGDLCSFHHAPLLKCRPRSLSNLSKFTLAPSPSKNV